MTWSTARCVGRAPPPALAELRQHIAVVLQDVFLFSGDIKGNINLGKESISFERIRDAAHIVGVDRFIDTLPKKYDEEVKERGATLSVGQKQLLSFARALAFDPAILVLDEATSSVDTETERAIRQTLDKLIQGRHINLFHKPFHRPGAQTQHVEFRNG